MQKILLKIANFAFGIYSDRPLVSLYLEEVYDEFLCTDEPLVRVYGHYSAFPDIQLSEKDKVFNSGTSWDVYKILDEKTMFVIKTPLFNPQPYCIAIFNTDYRIGDVYYNISNLGEMFNDLLPHPLAFPLFHLLMISLLSNRYGVLIHACGIDDAGRGYLFPGSSTHGKTTMAQLWKDEAVILNDDRIVLRENHGRFWIYGTPWHGEFDRVSSQGVPLEKVFFLRHARTNNTQLCEGGMAAAHLLKHCFFPQWDISGMNFILNFCAEIAEKIPCYELGFVPNNQIVDFVRCVK